MLKAMLQDVRKCLDTVDTLFSEHIVHHIDNYKKEEPEAEELNKQLAKELTQLQLGELCKQNKDKAKTQAPVIPAQTQVPETPTPQAPVMFQPPPQPPAPPGPVQAAPVNPPDSTLPTIQVHGGPSDDNYRSWKGRGGPMQRGGRPRGGGGRGPPPQQDRQVQPNPNLTDNQQTRVCWRCGQQGHLKRDCPSNLFFGPAADWQ